MKAGDLLVLRDVPVIIPGVRPADPTDKEECRRWLGESLLIIQPEYVIRDRLVKVLAQGRYVMVVDSYLELFYEVVS